MKNKIKQLRIDRGITSTMLAEIVGISQPSITRIENSIQAINSSRIESIARALSVHPSELFDYSDRPDLSQSELQSKIAELSPELLKQLSDFVDFLSKK